MDANQKQRLAKLAQIDQLAAEADKLPDGEQRQHLVDQIADLNVEVTLLSKD